MALELASYDLMPAYVPPFARGFCAALVATVSCYPLDTVRRHIQIASGSGVPWAAAAAHIWASDGLVGFYRGFIPSSLKNLPNKGIKLSVFDGAKRLLAAAEAARLQNELEDALEDALEHAAPPDGDAAQISRFSRPLSDPKQL